MNFYQIKNKIFRKYLEDIESILTDKFLNNELNWCVKLKKINQSERERMDKLYTEQYPNLIYNIIGDKIL